MTVGATGKREAVDLPCPPKVWTAAALLDLIPRLLTQRAEAKELRQGHKLKVLHPLKKCCQCGQHVSSRGLAPVEPHQSIVKQKDRAGSCVLHEPVKHFLRCVRQPIPGISAPGDGLISQKASGDGRTAVLVPKSRPENLDLVRGQDSGRRPYLIDALPMGQGREGRVIPRMIGNGMAGGGDLVDEVPMLRREFANHEKRCTCIISIKNFKDFRRDLWMRAVIKGEGNSWTRRIDVYGRGEGSSDCKSTRQRQNSA